MHPLEQEVQAITEAFSQGQISEEERNYLLTEIINFYDKSNRIKSSKSLSNGLISTNLSKILRFVITSFLIVAFICFVLFVYYYKKCINARHRLGDIHRIQVLIFRSQHIDNRWFHLHRCRSVHRLTVHTYLQNRKVNGS